MKSIDAHHVDLLKLNVDKKIDDDNACDMSQLLDGALNSLFQAPNSDKKQYIQVLCENRSSIKNFPDIFNYPSVFRQLFQLSNIPDIKEDVFSLLKEFVSSCRWCSHALFMSHIAENSIKDDPDILSVEFALRCAIFSDEIKDELVKLDFLSICLKFKENLNILQLILEVNCTEDIISSIDIEAIVKEIPNTASFNIISKITENSSQFCQDIFPILDEFMNSITPEYLTSDFMSPFLISIYNVLTDLGFNSFDTGFHSKLKRLCVDIAENGLFESRIEAINLLINILQRCRLEIVIACLDADVIDVIGQMLLANIDQDFIVRILITFQLLLTRFLEYGNYESLDMLASLLDNDFCDVLEELSESRSSLVANNAESLYDMLHDKLFRND